MSNMEPASDLEKGLVVVRGERWGAQRSWTERTGCKRQRLHVPQPWLTVLNNVMQQTAQNVKGREGTPPSRQWHKIALGESQPFTTEARRVIEAVEAGADDESVLALGEAFVAWTERVLATRRNLAERRGIFSDDTNSGRAA